jgi:hypothetical protein
MTLIRLKIVQGEGALKKKIQFVQGADGAKQGQHHASFGE